MTKRTIIIIDDEPMILSLIKEVLAEEPDLEVSAMVTKREDFFDQIGKKFFDVALIDLSLGKQNNGMELLSILKVQNKNLPVIIFSAHEERDYALNCLMSGAKGYINKSYICSDLARGCREVINGSLFVSGMDGDFILKEYHRVKSL